MSTKFAPIAAPRDWNDEVRAIVATYKSYTGPGYALNVESVDMDGYCESVYKR